jgi:hypothetical protein
LERVKSGSKPLSSLFPVAKSRDFILLKLNQQSELATHTYDYDTVVYEILTEDVGEERRVKKTGTTELKFFKNWPKEPGTFSFSVLEKLNNS